MNTKMDVAVEVDHSAMAMQAARQMRRSRQKQKTGRVICHHLRMMLATEAPVTVRPAFRRINPQNTKQQYSLGIEL